MSLPAATPGRAASIAASISIWKVSLDTIMITIRVRVRVRVVIVVIIRIIQYIWTSSVQNHLSSSAGMYGSVRCASRAGSELQPLTSRLVP